MSLAIEIANPLVAVSFTEVIVGSKSPPRENHNCSELVSNFVPRLVLQLTCKRFSTADECMVRGELKYAIIVANISVTRFVT